MFLLTLAHSFSILSASPISFPPRTLSPGPHQLTGFNSKDTELKCSIPAGRLRFLTLGPCEHTEPLLAPMSSFMDGMLVSPHRGVGTGR